MENSDQWFSELDEENVEYRYKIRECLFEQQSEFQTIAVYESEAYGKMLVIDDFVMQTEFDEFVYHEMIAHIPVCMHDKPKQVLVIGGGDGGTVRELLKHDFIESITLCEIDQLVVDVSREFLPGIDAVLADPRVNLQIGDGIDYIRELNACMDIIIVDSTDPIGPGEVLFSADFYQYAANALQAGGVMVAQTESAWSDQALHEKIQSNIEKGFKDRACYIGHVPTYPKGLWSWTIASQDALTLDALNIARLEAIKTKLNYLSCSNVKAAFCLPRFFRDIAAVRSIEA